MYLELFRPLSPHPSRWPPWLKERLARSWPHLWARSSPEGKLNRLSGSCGAPSCTWHHLRRQAACRPRAAYSLFGRNRENIPTRCHRQRLTTYLAFQDHASIIQKQGLEFLPKEDLSTYSQFAKERRSTEARYTAAARFSPLVGNAVVLVGLIGGGIIIFCGFRFVSEKASPRYAPSMPPTRSAKVQQRSSPRPEVRDPASHLTGNLSELRP